MKLALALPGGGKDAALYIYTDEDEYVGGVVTGNNVRAELINWLYDTDPEHFQRVIIGKYLESQGND